MKYFIQHTPKFMKRFINTELFGWGKIPETNNAAITSGHVLLATCSDLWTRGKTGLTKYIWLVLAILGFIAVTPLSAQTSIEISDDFQALSNTNYVVTPGQYDVRDVGKDGLFQIVNKENVVIDGADVEVRGLDSTGYFILIENSSNITIRNFKSVGQYYYAIKAKNCTGLSIEGNNFSFNRKDTVGWIFIWSSVNEALGGGVLLDNCRDSEIKQNTMIQQNDGVALYNCDNIHVHENTLNWNCGFGIRMNFTNNCSIHHNDCSHVNRLTDPSDCAAILLIVSNNNRVEHNDLTYSGDGIFLGQYEYHEIPNNNYFAYNDCSYSPHNAIEATFADGNVFKYNKCNFSHYGLWLGYSFNTLVEGNEIIGNLTAGIAVDRGFENTFVNNEIRQNPYGFQLWEGGVINPYGDQWSHDYHIYDNLIQGNMWGIHAVNTEHLVARNNDFIHNQMADIYLEGASENDTITRNFFNAPTFYFIQAMSDDVIEAGDNQFNPADRDMIIRKMRGTINWYPFVEGPAPKIMTSPPCDMAEPNAIWNIYADPGFGHRRDETIEFDSTDFKVGFASVKFDTPRGWDVGFNYRPAGDSIPMWELSADDALSFWVKTIKNPSYGFQGFFIRIGNYDHGYYQYTIPASDLNNAHQRWRHYSMPLRGSSKFVRTQVGNIDYNDINYVEFHADTWDFGYTLWLDGVQFEDCSPMGIEEAETILDFKTNIYPNPVDQSAIFEFYIQNSDQINLSIYDMKGVEVFGQDFGRLQTGDHQLMVNLSNLPGGVYSFRIYSTDIIDQGLFIKNPKNQ